MGDAQGNGSGDGQVRTPDQTISTTSTWGGGTTGSYGGNGVSYFRSQVNEPGDYLRNDNRKTLGAGSWY